MEQRDNSGEKSKQILIVAQIQESIQVPQYQTVLMLLLWKN